MNCLQGHQRASAVSESQLTGQPARAAVPWTWAVGTWLATVICAVAAAPTLTQSPVSQTVFLGDTATFQVMATGTAPLAYQWYRNGNLLPSATASTLMFITAPADDQAQFAVRVSNAEGAIVSPPALLTIDFGAPGTLVTNRWIDTTDPWRYSVAKADLGTAWTQPNYGDAAWPSGGGLLYVEDSALPGPKTTALPLSPGSLPRTCYFRIPFTNSITNAFSISLVAQVIVDDGVVGHLNGQELFRLGMPSESISFSTFANRTVGNAAWEGPFILPATNLAPGANVFAAEVHQVNEGSTDVVMGMTLEALWQPRVRDTNAPVVLNVAPAPGGTLSSLTQIEIEFNEPVRGVDAADLLVNGLPATNVTALAPAKYLFRFSPPSSGTVGVSWAVGHSITDRSVAANPFAGSGFSYLIGEVSTASQLAFLRVAQSSDALSANTAGRAVDGSAGTFSLTQDVPGSFWLGEFGRPFPVERLELVNRASPADVEFAGLVSRLYNLDDQIVFEQVLTNPGPAGIAVVPLPAGLHARSVWVGLPDNRTNGAGNFRVGLAEVRVFGVSNLPFGPPPVTTTTNAWKVWQSSEFGGYPASNAVDGDPVSFTHTDDLPDSYWMADLGRGFPIDRVEVVNRNSCCDNRLDGLVLRIFDGASNSILSTPLANPGLGGTWSYTPPSGTAGRWLRIGLEGGQQNGGGNFYVTLAEARVFSGATNLLAAAGGQVVPVTNNLASFKKSYMVRLDESVPPAARANDDQYNTETKTTVRTVDGYWEVDLGETLALYGLRAIAAAGIGYRLTNSTVRLYDAAHESVFAQRLSGGPDAFDMDFHGPHFARFVRVGLEDKQRTDPAGGIEFYIGFREVEVFGRPTNQVGLLNLTSSAESVLPGQSATLSWAVEDIRRLELHPAIGSVGRHTSADGTGSLTVTPAVSTEYVLVASNSAGFFTRAVGVEVGGIPLPVRLSEFVADNRYSLKDDYGEASDWVELRNTGNHPVELEGWGLSDDPGRPMKWTFPTTQLPAHGTLIVFASGRSDPKGPGGSLHANFRLEKRGGALLLTGPDGVTNVDRLEAYPEQDADLAYGRDLEGAWTFVDPTPGTVNAAPTYLGWLKPLDWSHTGGFCDRALTLTLTNHHPEATVLYSLDGSTPNLPYRQNLSISRTTPVRAQVVRAGYRPARVQTATFIFLSDVVTSPVMNPAITQDPAYASRIRPGLLALPSISLCLPGQPEYEEKEGSAEVIWPNGAPPIQVNCGISRFGNAWTKFEKRSFRIKCRAKYGEAKLNAPLFNGFDRGVLAKTSFDALDLRSGSQDMVERGFYMAGRFVEDSMLDMGSLNPHGRFVHVYVNGVYWGQYDCRELLVDHFLADYLGGRQEDYVVVRGNDNVSDDFVLGTPDPPNLEPWEQTRALRNSYQLVRERLDVSHLIDFMLLWNYGNCESEFRACGPIAPGSGFKFWIADADGFLRTSAAGLNRTDRLGPGGLFGGMVAQGNSDFKTLLADRIYRHFYNQGALTPAANDARLAARMQEIQDSLLAECARWGYRTPANWVSAANSIRSNLFPTRSAQLVGYWRNRGLYPAFEPPTFNPYGGLVTNGFMPSLSSSSGTIYYTLDGTDPRSSGGAISPAARTWVPGAVTVTNDLTIQARVRTAAGTWSALAQPRFLLASRRPPKVGDLLITEIHYNPAGSDDFEFIELFNASPSLLDLSGVALTNAVRFVFPPGFALAPGAFVLVTENTNAFAARYQTTGSSYFAAGLNLAGEWVGALDNAGETLTLSSSNRLELASVDYRPGGSWPNRADGQGSSLELRALPTTGMDETALRAFLASALNWTASSGYHGSPGRFDDFVPTVRFSEILSHTDAGTDWVELLNTGEGTVDLSDCVITDDLGAGRFWPFPTGTVMMPGEFRVLDSSQLGFGFSEGGEAAFLLQLAGTNRVRFLDSVEFPAAALEESLGLYQRSDGAFDFTEQRYSTRAAPNSLPRVGPVVMSEILFAPTAGMAQYVELTSLTNGPLPLYDPVRPTNSWVLDGVGAFVFPPGTALAACASIIVCSTEPATFRTQYSVPDSVPVFGPWSGRLDEDGETIRLLRPGEPKLDGSVPYYRVDHVTYRTDGAWALPAAGGCLERIPVQAFGNDPASWRAGPARGTPGVPAANRPPTVSVVGETEVDELTPLNLAILAADPDAPWQTATVRITRLPPGSSFDEETGALNWTPLEAQGPGLLEAEVVVADDAACDAQSARETVSITVKEVNQPPSWTPHANIVHPAGSDLVIPLTVTDPDLPVQTLQVQATGLPSGLDLLTHPLRVAGKGQMPGIYEVELTAADNQSPPLQTSLRFTLRLTEPFSLSATREPTGVRLSFATIAGQTYEVEWTEDLGQGRWVRLAGPMSAPGEQLTLVDTVLATSPARYYRVRWVR